MVATSRLEQLDLSNSDDVDLSSFVFVAGLSVGYSF